MESILNYTDYRKYMQDYYSERKLHSAFSWREFSAIAGFASPVYMKLVCEGKSSLSKSKMGRVAQALNLIGYERDYFEQMIIFGNAKNESVKNRALQEMQRIADVCNEEVSPQEVQRVLTFLTKHGFLKKSHNGNFVQTEKTVIGSKEDLPLAIRSMHKEIVKTLDEQIDSQNLTILRIRVNNDTDKYIYNVKLKYYIYNQARDIVIDTYDLGGAEFSLDSINSDF